MACAEPELAVDELDLETGGAQRLEPASLDGRIRVVLTGDHLSDACLEDGLDARWRRAMVRARLQGHVKRGSPRTIARLAEGNTLCMPARRPSLGGAFSHDLAVAGDDERADGRLRVGALVRVVDEVERALEELPVHAVDPTVGRVARP